MILIFYCAFFHSSLFLFFLRLSNFLLHSPWFLSFHCRSMIWWYILVAGYPCILVEVDCWVIFFGCGRWLWLQVGIMLQRWWCWWVDGIFVFGTVVDDVAVVGAVALGFIILLAWRLIVGYGICDNDFRGDLRPRLLWFFKTIRMVRTLFFHQCFFNGI